MSREQAIARARAWYETGEFAATLSRRIAYATESQAVEQRGVLRAYLEHEMVPSLRALGFSQHALWDNPIPDQPPFLFAQRDEPGNTLTVLMYAHGDVVRGMPELWRAGLDPWQLRKVDGRLYGRGSADNKGQHTINLGALQAVLAARQHRLGFNIKLLMEMGEEVGSPGLATVVEHHQDQLRADLFVASDGPRFEPEVVTLALGSRGYLNFTLSVQSRAKPYHSGNWGGLLSNPAIVLANAIASIVDGRGAVQVPALLPTGIPASIDRALAPLVVRPSSHDAHIDPGWGQPGLSATQKLYAWNTFEVVALDCENPKAPANAIPPAAHAHCHMRLVKGTDSEQVRSALRAHLDAHGYAHVALDLKDGSAASRLSPDNPWVRFVAASIDKTLGKAPAILPNIGGSIPNAPFADTLGLPTLWIPHSYAACGQHGPDEHLLETIAKESLEIMAGVWWDLGEQARRLPV